ncbi:5,10-methylenetetrahydrofolate reductase [Elstera litoralis]|uniref:Methylenetetrahydrofolate reductase n=1 Tax=Elstera litoralis TaxID=552518 RepID=A0A0F3IVG1_9PROT|nr:methylenetetrahydrofolate reductase [NAD(P)H] [Elstera litoralis]KJV10617.1 5,10-methylenetetrahydrofolate reductase [Elstera litoralis]
MSDSLAISFEFFPPKTPEMEASLWSAVEKLAPLNPSFVSVTYGAGGSTRERTHATVRRLRQETKLEPAAHLTCVAATREDIDAIARDYWASGIRHIVALRGDTPTGGPYEPTPGGYGYSTDLVAGLTRIAPFEISVAAYPEGHPESKSLDADLDVLKRKVDAGATRAITQYFFETDLFVRFVERARKAGISIPIVPGILPVTNVAQVLKFSKACGTSVPQWLADTFDGLDADPETRKLVAASVAAEQVLKLKAEGISDFHFYTLNRADLTLALCRRLGVRAPAAA